MDSYFHAPATFASFAALGFTATLRTTIIVYWLLYSLLFGSDEIICLAMIPVAVDDWFAIIGG
jgi:hypothetical protein